MNSPSSVQTMAQPTEDLSALAWVNDELRQLLDAAHKALRRFVKESEVRGGGTPSVAEAKDPAVLRSARSQIHQGVGALELVGLPAAATVLRASEAAVQRFVARPDKLTFKAVEDIEHASFALLEYVARLLAHRQVSALAMFPQYQVLQEMTGADRIHPADLWSFDWQWREIPNSGVVAPLTFNTETHAALEAQLLEIMRTPEPFSAVQKMSDLCAGLGVGSSSPAVATLWKLAAAVFEAQTTGLLAFDVFSKRVASRLLAQHRMLEAGESEVSERLAQDLLFFCAQSKVPAQAHQAPRLMGVRKVYDLSTHQAVDYSISSLGKFDPALIAQSRKRVVAAKESWSGVAGGEMHRMTGLTEQFALVGESLKRLFPNGDKLAAEMHLTMMQVQKSGESPTPTLAMEVATGMLYVEAVLEDADFDHAEQPIRVERLAQRLGAVRQGQPSEPLESWMEELYRRVSDRQTMGSVVQELRSALSESEKLMDQFFRNPLDRQALVPVPGQFSAMRGVLSVLGIDQACAALLRMRDEIDGLVVTETDPEQLTNEGVFDRLANNLGAMGFLIDMLGVQPQVAKSLFIYDAEKGLLSPVMGRAKARVPSVAEAAVAAPSAIEPRLVEQAQLLAETSTREDVSLDRLEQELHLFSQEAQAADQPALASTVQQAQIALEQASDDEALFSVRGQLSEALIDFVATASGPIGLDPEGPVTPVPTDEIDYDDEMLGIFLEEAREVIDAATTAVQDLVKAPSDVSLTTSLRRGFHTLKGSARMVGLKDFGDAGWICEQIYNTQLAEPHPADERLLSFTGWVLEYMSEWVNSIAERSSRGHQCAVVEAAAQRLSAPVEASAVADTRTEPTTTEQVEMEVAEQPVLVSSDGAEETVQMDLLEVEAEGQLVLASPAEEQSNFVDVVTPIQSIDFDFTSIDLGLESSEISGTELVPEEAQPSAFSEPILLPSAPSSDLLASTLKATLTSIDEENVKVVGSLRIGLPLFNIYLNEADELSRRLSGELHEWVMESSRPVGENVAALAHSLAGSSATVGFADLSHLSRSLEHALMRSHAIGGGTHEEAQLFAEVSDEIRHLLHQFAGGALNVPSASLLDRLAAHEVDSARRLEAMTTAEDLAALTELEVQPLTGLEPDAVPESVAVTEAQIAEMSAPAQMPELRPLPAAPVDGPVHSMAALDDLSIEGEEDLDAVDAIDAELFPIFDEEARELLPELATQLRNWVQQPADMKLAAACMRTLHTLKGGARLAGAMRMGELAHRMETRVERVIAHPPAELAEVEALQALGDGLTHAFDRVNQAASEPVAPVTAAVSKPDITEAAPTAAASPAQTRPIKTSSSADEIRLSPVAPASGSRSLLQVDWTRFVSSEQTTNRVDAAVATRASQTNSSGASVRIRTPILDRLVNQAGEVSITRSRIESSVHQIKDSLSDLTDNLERLRIQLRDIELQAETQMSSRLEAAKAASQSFDPLEFDRFTRFQEITRMMAESVNDVATVQRTLQRSLEVTEDELVSQSRMTRELQDDLLRTRMVEFEGLSDRLYRVARQAAKEMGKQVRLDIVGGSIEVDRGILDRMTGAFEHLLRNCVTHGIELPAERVEAGKDASGRIVITVSQEGNEVGVEFRDDGAGLNLTRIRDRGIAMGLINAKGAYSEAELANLVFTPGFSTAQVITELAGRGVGMDVVKSEVAGIGGRIETATSAGQGTSFKLILPLTTAVTQIVMLRCGEITVAVPSTLIEVVHRASQQDINQSYAQGTFSSNDRSLPFFWLGALLQANPRSLETTGRMRAVVVIRSAQQRVALHVDEVLGNQEAVVKNLGPQMSRMPGLAGMTLLASGAVALIYNPVALVALYGEDARAATAAALQDILDGGKKAAAAAQLQADAVAPLVMVVDDPLTVRRITQRLLVREGYRVVLAKDGLDALERLAEELPQVVLSDIEMPRMDGFDLVRNMRADERLKSMPVIMITSRIAQKHRDYAAELGVNHYLGKPYSEEDLLALLGRYTTKVGTVTQAA